MPLEREKKIDYSLVATIFILVFFGLIVLTSASSAIGFAEFSDSYYFLKHQLLFGLLPGLILFFILSKLNYKLWFKNAKYIYFFALVLLVLVFVPGIGAIYNNARSWIKLGNFTLQPSEIAKLALIIYLAAFFSLKADKIKNFKEGVIPFVTTSGIFALLILLQPDMGTMFIFVIVALGMFFAAGANLKHIFSLLALGGIAFLILIKTAPYRLQRLIVFLNPEADPLGIGYHISQALLAIGSGGLFGLGLGHSRQKFQYLPEVAGDSIFAVMAEELGFVLSAFFVLLLLFFVFKSLRIAKSSSDGFARLFAIGIALWIGGQAIINIGAMVGVLPLTGVPLPFISFGGTALMSVLAGCGILVNISRR